VRELAVGFGTESDTLETIRKGVLDRQLLATVELSYLNGDGKIVGRIKLAIDWKDHTFLAESNDGKSIVVNPNASLSEQISEAYLHLLEHGKQVRKAFGVIRTDARFTYRPEIHSEPQKLAEARAYLGTSPATSLEWVSGATGVKRPDFSIDYRSDKLRELFIRIEHAKP
jgi:hypothetical protein